MKLNYVLIADICAIFMLIHMAVFAFTGLALWAPVTADSPLRGIMLSLIHVVAFLAPSFVRSFGR